MKFIYEYRSRDNIPHRGVINASDKDAAYAALKSKGIKPGRVVEAPGLINLLLGKGKRWIAIAVLLAVAVAALYVSRTSRQQVAAIDESRLYEDRGQLYGDPVILNELEKDCWASTFTEIGDRFLAAYAIPCKMYSLKYDMNTVLASLQHTMHRRYAIADNELLEVAQMKRMVNGMKRELQEYVEAGGNIAMYVRKLDIRQKAEKEVYEQTKRELSRNFDMEVWREKNGSLRAKGLPLIEMGGAD